MNKNYQTLSDYYDKFSQNDCDYTRWSQYLFTVATDCGAKTVADLACGTGKMTVLLKNMGLAPIGVDVSEQMLARAAAKCPSIKFIAQDVTKLRLTKPQDMAVCVNDGVNYVSPAKLPALFKSVAANLKSGAPFVFDVSSPYKLFSVLLGNVFYVDDDQATLLWTNTKAGDNAVRLELTIFERQPSGDYVRRDESHVQYAHDRQTIEAALGEAGFELVEVTSDYGLPLVAQSLRVTYYAKKKN